MKHIFVVHSHITYLAALGVIFEEKIPNDNLLIISETFKLSYEPIPIKKVESCNNRTFFSDFFYHYNIDKIVDDFIEDSQFIAYVPVFHLLYRYVVTHPRCIKYNIIEEGLSSYYDYFEGLQQTFVTGNKWRYKGGLKGLVERIYDIKLIFKGISPSILAIPTFYSAYVFDPHVTFYGFDNEAFKNASCKKILSLRKISKHYNFTSKYNISNSVVWIGDPDIYFKVNNINEIKTSVENSIINYLIANNIVSIYVRFHYRESREHRSFINNLFISHGITITEIDHDSIMEIELINSDNVTLIGFYSSLLVYGNIMGHKSISIHNYLPKSLKNNTFSPDKQLSFFWKHVSKL